MATARVVIHGARGSFPVSGKAYRRYGGHTSCMSLETDEGLIVVDAGTGIASLGEELSRRDRLPPITILLTHLHLDHVAGIPAFKPMYEKKAQIHFLADPTVLGRSWPGTLRKLVGKPFWPVEVFSSGAHIRVGSLPSQGRSLELYGVEVSWIPIRHPQGCLSYRFETSQQILVWASDREHGRSRVDRAFLEFCRGADLLIHDAQYLPEEYPRHREWGHSTWKMASRVAREVQANHLLLTSHDPARTDQQIDQLVANARTVFPNTSAAAENQVVQIRRIRR